MTRTPKHHTRSRSTGYRYEGEFDESAVEHVLKRAVTAKVVTEFDTGRGEQGSLVWFNGYPGRALRAVRDEVRSLMRNPRVY